MRKINSCIRNYTARGSFEAKDVRVLFIDDVQNDMSVERDLKYLFGIDSDVSASTPAVLTRIVEKRYDIIFIDYSLINNDFEEMTEKIRKLGSRNPKLSHYFMSVPIIVLVSNNACGGRKIVLGNGIDDFIPRPVQLYYIDRLMRKWLPADKRIMKHVNADAEYERMENISDEELHGDKERNYCRNITVRGIDMERCLKACGFDKKKFLMFIGESYKIGLFQIEAIETCMKRRDIPNYIELTGKLKDFAKGLGSDTLYELAKSQQIAAYSGNYAYVFARNDNLLDCYYKIVSSMGEVLTENNIFKMSIGEHERLPISYLEFRNEMLLIFMYLDEIRPYTAMKAIYRLIQCQIGEDMIKKLTDVVALIDDMDYERAMYYLTEILRSQETSI